MLGIFGDWKHWRAVGTQEEEIADSVWTRLYTTSSETNLLYIFLKSFECVPCKEGWQKPISCEECSYQLSHWCDRFLGTAVNLLGQELEKELTFSSERTKWYGKNSLLKVNSCIRTTMDSKWIRSSYAMLVGVTSFRERDRVTEYCCWVALIGINCRTGWLRPAWLWLQWWSSITCLWRNPAFRSVTQYTIKFITYCMW